MFKRCCSALAAGFLISIAALPARAADAVPLAVPSSAASAAAAALAPAASAPAAGLDSRIQDAKSDVIKLNRD
ncbi:MAG TPA: hypothetical protein VGP22_05865, partial [Albitalea sp.]|nr:hypothetical protein [Albitalea sp.]